MAECLSIMAEQFAQMEEKKEAAAAEELVEEEAEPAAAESTAQAPVVSYILLICM